MPGLLACVRRAVAAGDLPAETDATALATMYSTFLLGLSCQARDGVPAAPAAAVAIGDRRIPVIGPGDPAPVRHASHG